MSSVPIRELSPSEFPALLAEIPQPPKQLWAAGILPPSDLPLLAVVGSRKYSIYGRQVAEHLIAGLAPYSVGIVSGLAIGIDGIAHEAALANQLYTLAVPGSGLDRSVMYPARHRALAEKILNSGGGLLSELPPTVRAALWTFPARNRIMAGMCQATLLIEADAKSGTLITARMAVDYNRELLVVPGSIFSSTSYGTHQFLKLGATPVTTAEDIVTVLDLVPQAGRATPAPLEVPAHAVPVLTHLTEPRSRDVLIRLLNLPVSTATVLLMQLEMEGFIRETNGTYTAMVTMPSSPAPTPLFDSRAKT